MAWYVPGEPHYFESEGFGVEIPLRPKRNGQIDLPEWERLHSRDDPMERD